MARNQCNIRIEDPHYHEMHHALGRPWPNEIMGETYRNYFATSIDSDIAKRMRSSAHWSSGTDKFEMVYFSVTEQGKVALKQYMLSNIELPARYMVTYHDSDGHTLVAAKSRSAAKYAAYLSVDAECEFIEFVAEIASIRLYTHANKIVQEAIT